MSQDTFKICPRNFIDETGPLYVQTVPQNIYLHKSFSSF